MADISARGSNNTALKMSSLGSRASPLGYVFWNVKEEDTIALVCEACHQNQLHQQFNTRKMDAHQWND